MNMAKPMHPVTLVTIAGIPAVALVAYAAMQGGMDRYLPHGVCYAWQPGLIRLHLVSDVLIGLAYLAIPVALVHFIRRRADIPFNWMFLLFGLFIVACGATHWMEVWTLWNPTYWVAGAVKAITAAASVPTAILLFMLAVPAFGWFAPPLMAQLSRRDEFEADAYAVAQTSGRDLSGALLKLYQDNASTLTPDPVYVRFYYSHPPASERLARMSA